MDNNFLIALLIAMIIMVGVLFWLVKVYLRLKQEFLKLGHTLEQNNQDIAGLCSAAVSVDRRLIESAGEIHGISDKISASERAQKKNNNPPYHNAIQKIRNGAKAEELIELCGLSREEANLLINMHSHNNG